MAWFDCAVRRPISGHTSGPLRAQRGLVLHHAVANGSLYDRFNSPAVEASTQFWVARSGLIEQYLDSTMSAWATGSNTGNMEYNSVETEGCVSPPYADPMTPEMVAALARLYAEGNARHGWAFQLCNSVGQNGFGYHRLFFNTACPCDVRLSARQEILDQAQGKPPKPPEPPPTPEGIPVSAIVIGDQLHNFAEVPDPKTGLYYHWWQFLPGKGQNPPKSFWVEALPTS